MVIVEGFHYSLAEKKDWLELVSGVCVDPSLKGSNFLSRVIFIVFVLILISDSLLVRVNAPVTPSLLTLFEGFKLSSRHQHFPPGLGARSIGISSLRLGRLVWSSHCRGSSLVRLDEVSHQLVVRVMVIAGQWSVVRAGGHAAV